MIPNILAAAIARAPSGTVTVSGESVASNATDPANAVATIRFNQDGTVDKIEDGVTTQVDSATDWLIPNSRAPADFEIRYTGHTGDALDAEPAAENIWFALSDGNASFTLIQASVGAKSANFTIEIRKGSSGAALDTGAYSLSATVT